MYKRTKIEAEVHQSDHSIDKKMECCGSRK